MIIFERLKVDDNNCNGKLFNYELLITNYDIQLGFNVKHFLTNLLLLFVYIQQHILYTRNSSQNSSLKYYLIWYMPQSII